MDVDSTSPESSGHAASTPSSMSTPPSTITHISSTSIPARIPPRPPGARRNRAVLSCYACRTSKLKCDRNTPCGQCVKRSRSEACSYSPKPDRQRPAPRGMASRLRRLEGLVREMMQHQEEGGGGDGSAAAVAAAMGISVGGSDDQSPQGEGGEEEEPEAEEEEEDDHDDHDDEWQQKKTKEKTWQGKTQSQIESQNRRMESLNSRTSGTPRASTRPLTRSRVVVSQNGSGSFVGATHFMAMLEDIEDMKSYFDDPEAGRGGEDALQEEDDLESPELLFDTRGSPRTKADFIALLPERSSLGRLIMRYFTACAPSSFMIHRPSFTREFARFCQDPNSVTLDWLGQVFMMIALGIFYSSFTSPHELEAESTTPPMTRFRRYRTIAGWAIVASKYIFPQRTTLVAMMLFIEAEFITARATKTYSYILIGVLLRLMLKMGMHRDPDKLGIAPFEGEMRRRLWAVACQVDMLMAFHLGLPGFLHCIETDTRLPSNILDDEFDESSVRLPRPHPLSDATPMQYPISKSTVMRVFGQVAALAHRLSPPPHSEVVRLDRAICDAWEAVPPFMKPRPLDECVTDTPQLLIQRYGVASLHYKSRCVLHRAYLGDRTPAPEHDASRRICAESALALLRFQDEIYHASQPGGVLSPNGWFFKSLTVHDYLLAAMVVFIVLQNEQSGVPDRWRRHPIPLAASSADMLGLLKRARVIWWETHKCIPDVTKPAEFMDSILRRLGVGPEDSLASSVMPSAASAVDSQPPFVSYSVPEGEGIASLSLKDQPQPLQPPMPGMYTDPMAYAPMPMTLPSQPSQAPQPQQQQQQQQQQIPMGQWGGLDGSLDWRYLDQVLSQREQANDDAHMETDWLVSGPTLADFGGLEMGPSISDSWFQR